MKLTPIQQVVYDAFKAAKLDPCLGLAIAEHESDFNPSAVAGDPRDWARGGSFGLMQISIKTARAYDKNVTPAQLCIPAYHMRIAVRLMLDLKREFQGREEDMISGWNSGKPFYRAPDSTKLSYVPAVQKNLAKWRAALAPAPEAVA